MVSIGRLLIELASRWSFIGQLLELFNKLTIEISTISNLLIIPEHSCWRRPYTLDLHGGGQRRIFLCQSKKQKIARVINIGVRNELSKCYNSQYQTLFTFM